MSLKRSLPNREDANGSKIAKSNHPKFNAVFRPLQFQGGFIPIQQANTGTQTTQLIRCIRCNATKYGNIVACFFCMKQVCNECIQMCCVCTMMYCYNCVCINYEQPVTTYRCIDCNHDIRNKRK